MVKGMKGRIKKKNPTVSFLSGTGGQEGSNTLIFMSGNRIYGLNFEEH